MKFVVVAALALMSVASFANIQTLSSSTKINSVGASCYDASGGRSANYGIGKYCFDYTKTVTKTQKVVDVEASKLGLELPGPFTTVSKSKEQQCVSGALWGGDGMQNCEAIRAAKAKQVR